jgi:DNA repair exonuclease SbcCD ATPase subunit
VGALFSFLPRLRRLGLSTRGKDASANRQDSLYPRLLGVSGAILENAIFCHQDDSCWRLDCTTRELKHRLDLIFEAE